jgi:hypothetical protein
MQNTDNDDLSRTRKVVDSVFLMEDHSKIGRKVGPRRTGQWKRQDFANPGFKARQKSGRDRLGRLGRQIAPYLRESISPSESSGRLGSQVAIFSRNRNLHSHQ